MMVSRMKTRTSVALLLLSTVSAYTVLVAYDTVEDLQQACRQLTCLKTYTSGFVGALVSQSEATVQTESIGSYDNLGVYAEAVGPMAAGVQFSPPWHLDRVDHRGSTLTGVFSYLSQGSGVNIYVLDTGINGNHSEFIDDQGNSRVVHSYDAVTPLSPLGDDCEGHGTAVASLAAGLTLGAAKNATVHNIRTLGCSGSSDTDVILSALEWVIDNAQLPAVVTCSFGTFGVLSPPMNKAIAVLAKKGIPVFVSAGNEHIDACLVSPSSAEGVVAVGALGYMTDRPWDMSNFGECVYIWAPGQTITCADYNHNYGTIKMTGTSMAAPIAAGIAATFLQVFNITFTELKEFLKSDGVDLGDEMTLIQTLRNGTCVPANWTF